MTARGQSRALKYPSFAFERTITRFVSGYVGSAKKTYRERYCRAGITLTNSGSPASPKSAPPVMYPAR